MMSSLHRKVLTIFLATPGDLSEERHKTREAVDRFCKVMGSRLGWHIDLLGWEDTLPGYARPQSLINQDVERCDLFIGILWRRWGQSTGRYESGFLEEFTLARERHGRTGKPDIWLFFKFVDPDNLKDPGEQLKKVIRFKKEQIKLKELYFKEFSDGGSWSDIIYDSLSGYILDITRQESQIESKAYSSLAEHSTEGMSISKLPEEAVNYPEETIALFDNIARDLKSSSFVGLDFWSNLRLLLQSSSWFAVKAPWKFFDNHEINYVYARRNDWMLSNEEWLFLVRSFITPNYNLRPGWFWLSKGGDKEVDEMLCGLTEIDIESSVRKMAFSLLADTKYKAPLDFIKKGLADSDNDIILNAIRLLKNTENVDYIDLLEPLVKSNQSDVQNQAIIARIELIYRKDPKAAFTELIASGTDIPPVIYDTLESIDLKLDTALLINALEHGNISVRRFSAQYLRKAKLLKPDAANKMLTDTDALVRKEGILALIELGENFDLNFVDKLFSSPNHPQTDRVTTKVEPEEIYPLILKNREPSELLASLQLFAPRSEDYYRFLATEHFAIIEPRIRSDLDNEFEQLRAESVTQMIQKYTDEAQSIIDSYSQELIDYLKAKFVSGALAGLAKNGTKDDIKYARKYLGKTAYNIADYSAIAIIAKYGNNSDVGGLVQLASNIFGEDIIKHAILTALDLSSDKIELVKTLINNNNLVIAKIAMQYIINCERDAKINLAKDSLVSERDDIRLIGTAVLIKELDEPSLEKLLNEYTERPKYYYNVVSWFDRCLYAPGRYKKHFKEQISKNLY